MRSIAGILMCLLLAAATAAEKPHRDFSAGFAMLREMAVIPDLAQAEPGRIRHLRLPAQANAILRAADLEDRFEGVHWKLGENPDGSLRILLCDLWVVSLYPTKPEDESRIAGEWQPLDTKGLVRTAVRGIAAEGKRNRGGMGGGMGGGMEGEDAEGEGMGSGEAVPDEHAGGLLLQAALLHAAGEREAANELAGVLLADARQAENAIAGAFSLAAQRQYTLALLGLAETGDRDRFLAALREIVERFPRGWGGRTALDYIVQSMQAPQEPSAAVKALPEEDQKLVAEVIAGTRYRPMPNCQGWLLFAPPVAIHEPDSALVRLLRKGIDAIPILVAMREDGRATRFLATGPTPRMRQHAMVAADAETDDEEDMLLDDESKGMRYGETTSLPYPMGAGELAEAMLAQFRGHPGAPESDDPGSTAARAQEWHRTYRGKPREEIAHSLLAQSDWRQMAITYLLARPLAETDYPAIEQAIAQEDGFMQLAPLELLVERRGQKALPAIERAIETAKEASHAKWVVSHLQAVQALAACGPASMEEFRQRLEGAIEKDDFAVLNALPRSVARLGDWDGAVELLLEQAIRATEAKKRDRILRTLRQLGTAPVRGERMYGRARVTWEEFDAAAGPRGPEDTDEGTAPRPRLDLRRHLAAWRKILPDGIPDGVLLGQIFESRSPMFAFLALHDPDDRVASELRGWVRLWETLPGGAAARLFRRTQGVLAGSEQPLPPWPDPDSVSSERVSQLVEALSKLPAEAARQHALSLPDNEQLALLGQLRLHGTLAEGLLAEPRRVLPGLRPVGTMPAAVREAFAGFAGRRVSKEQGEALLATARRLVGEGHSFVLLFQAGPGLRLVFEAVSIDSEARPLAEAARIVAPYRLDPGLASGPGVHIVLTADMTGRAFSPLHQTAKPDVGQDQPLEQEDDLEGMFIGDGPETSVEELLQELDKTNDALGDPECSVALLLVGVGEKTWQQWPRTKDENRAIKRSMQ